MSILRVMKKSDLLQVNNIISSAFSQRRKLDGFAETFFPPCRMEFLQMYLAACPTGCFVIESNHKVIAAAICHLDGKTGWIGPIVVAPRHLFQGLGTRITRHCIDFLKECGCKTIGLETTPSSNDNLGFYGRLGFDTDCLIVEMLRAVNDDLNEVAPFKYQIFSYNQASTDRKRWFLQQMQMLCRDRLGSTDYTNMVQQIFNAHYGDSFLFMENTRTIGLAIAHFDPATVNEKREVMRILTFIMVPGVPESYLPEFIKDLEQVARDEYLSFLRFRVPTRCQRAFHLLLEEGFRIVYTNVRMTLQGYPQQDDPAQFHLNCWV